jgi:hypothetical protein
MTAEAESVVLDQIHTGLARGERVRIFRYISHKLGRRGDSRDRFGPLGTQDQSLTAG